MPPLSSGEVEFIHCEPRQSASASIHLALLHDNYWLRQLIATDYYSLIDRVGGKVIDKQIMTATISFYHW